MLDTATIAALKQCYQYPVGEHARRAVGLNRKISALEKTERRLIGDDALALKRRCELTRQSIDLVAEQSELIRVVLNYMLAQKGATQNA